MTRERIIVRGRVQGVGFRWFAREAARRWGLDGWVRNREDGSVEAVVAGEPDSIEGLTKMLAVGPAGARVESVSRETVEDESALPHPFAILK